MTSLSLHQSRARIDYASDTITRLIKFPLLQRGLSYQHEWGT